MGPVLGLDTGTPIAALGLASRGHLIAGGSREAGPHGANLPAAVDELLRCAGLGIDDLAGIAVGIGPGSFTGLRIALSYAKGLIRGLRCPIVGIPSLDAIALGALQALPDEGASAICPVVDARRGELYAGLYRIMPDRLEKLSDDLVVTLDWLVPRLPDRTVLVGDRRVAEAKSLVGMWGGTVLEALELSSRGAMVAALGADRIARGDADQAAALEPLYVRPPQAALRVAGADRTDVGTEGLWSREKSHSSNTLQPMTRS